MAGVAEAAKFWRQQSKGRKVGCGDLASRCKLGAKPVRSMDWKIGGHG